MAICLDCVNLQFHVSDAVGLSPTCHFCTAYRQISVCSITARCRTDFKFSAFCPYSSTSSKLISTFASLALNLPMSSQFGS